MNSIPAAALADDILNVATKSGKKTHAAHAGSSVTFCGHWMKINASTMHSYARGRDIDCERCIDSLTLDGSLLPKYAVDETQEAPAPEGEVTPEEAAEELARRAHNRKAKKDDSLTRREATNPAAFAMGTKELKAIAEG